MLSILRVILSIVWTGLVGIFLLAVIGNTYLVALIGRALGYPDQGEKIIAWNTKSTCQFTSKAWSNILLKISGISLQVEGKESIDWEKTHVICANHSSLFDIFALVSSVPPPFRFVAKKELLKWPIVGWALRPAGQIIVDRSNRSAAINNLARAAVRNAPGQVIFFVEGTRSRSGKLLQFKKGAFHFALDNELPVLPTAIVGAHEVLGRTLWWQFGGGRNIRVCFGRPIPPKNADHANKPEALNSSLDEARTQIASKLEGHSSHNA